MAFLIILLMCSIFINIVFGYGFIHFYNEWRIDEKIINKASEELEEVTQTKSCLDCPNYDKENHYCPKFCEVIRNALKEIEEDKSNSV